MSGFDSGGESDTQEELARRAEVPKISVSHFETGHRFPNAESLRRLAESFTAQVVGVHDGDTITVYDGREQPGSVSRASTARKAAPTSPSARRSSPPISRSGKRSASKARRPTATGASWPE